MTSRRPGALAAVLAPLTRRLVYPSAGTRVAPAETDLHLGVRGAELRGWVVNPGCVRAVVYLGGNGEALDWLRAPLATWLPDHTTYLMAYRGYGASSGRPSERALLADALAVHDHVAAGHPETPVAVIGRSLGSGVAVQLAVRRPVERLVLVTPFDSLVAVAADLFSRLPVTWLLAERWESAAVAPDLTADVLVLRAGRDTVVRPPRTDALLAVLPGTPDVVDFAGADHRSLSDDPAYWRAIAAFLG